MEQTPTDKNIQQLIKHKNLLLVGLVVFISFMVGVSFFGDYNSKRLIYKNQINEKLQKIEVIAQLDKSKQELAGFKASFVKELDADSLLNQLADYAVQNKISILNISPGQTTTREQYTTTNVHLSIKAESFKDMISFFYTIETSPYVLKIQSWSTRLENGSESVTCDVDIVFVQIK